MKLRILWLSAAALAVALTGQVTVNHLHAPTSPLHASWINQPHSLAEARTKAQSIVLAEVVSAARGDDIVIAAPGEPNGQDRIATQRITLKVLKGYKGAAKAGATVTLFQTGGLALPTAAPKDGKGGTNNVQQALLEGDPAYRQGEQYLLMLETGPKDMQRTISPEGRYRLAKDGTLTPMVDNEATRDLSGKPLAKAEAAVAGAQN